MQFKSLMCVFQAEDDLDAHEWMEAIQGVTACLLNGNVDIEALSKAQPKPSKPTHSRQGSRAGKPKPTPTWCGVLLGVRTCVCASVRLAVCLCVCVRACMHVCEMHVCVRCMHGHT